MLRRLMRASCVLVVVMVVAAARPVRAQDPHAEARERFSRAVELYDEGRYEAALVEFQRAYDLAPAAPVLFNIAQVHAAMGHAVAAVAAYERYLAEGGEAISAARRADVEAALRTQRARIARLTIAVSAPGATIAIDDVEVGISPLPSAIEVDSGEHVVSARAAGHEGVRRRIRIAGGREEIVRLELLASDTPRGSIRVSSPLPAVEILIDERPVGLTPFDGTIAVPVGPHRVRARRDGYLALESDVIVEAGAERELRFPLARDPAAPEAVLGTLALDLPDGERSIMIDGEEIESIRLSERFRGPHPSEDRVITRLIDGRAELPAGPHEIVIRAAGREPWRGTIEIPVRETVRLAPELEWTPDAIDAHNAAADLQLGLGIGTAIAGGIALAIGIGIWLDNQGQWSRLVAEYTEVNVICRGMETSAMCLDAIPAGHPRNLALYEDHVNQQRDWRMGTDVGAVITMALGGTLALAGVLLLITTPGHRARSTRVSLGPGALSGSF